MIICPWEISNIMSCVFEAVINDARKVVLLTYEDKV